MPHISFLPIHRQQSSKNVLVGNSSNMVLHDTSSADKYLQLTYVE